MILNIVNCRDNNCHYNTGADMDFDEARRVKEDYVALRNQHEYDTKSGLVVMGGAVLKEVGEEYANVRTNRLLIPSKQSQQLQLYKTVEAIEKIFMGVISEALEELTKDEMLTLSFFKLSKSRAVRFTQYRP